MFRSSVVWLALLAAVSLPGRACGDWIDHFTGGAHNPPGGEWGFAGFTLDNPPQEMAGYQPRFADGRVRVPTPVSPTNGDLVSLVAGWVGSTAGTTHHYRDVRVAGTVGVGDNHGQGNNNEVGLLARANDFDVYVLLVDHSQGQARLAKSLNANPGAPVFMATAPITGYAPLSSYQLVLDVMDTAAGSRLVGRVYENSPARTLLNTLIATDDHGNAVAGAPLPAFYSGFFAQYNADVPNARFVDAWFDDVASYALRPGDVDLSGEVSRADLRALLHGVGRGSGATWDDGDMDGDGSVGLRDLIRLRNALPPTSVGPSLAGAAAVPEPATGLLAAVAGIFLVALRRARR